MQIAANSRSIIQEIRRWQIAWIYQDSMYPEEPSLQLITFTELIDNIVLSFVETIPGILQKALSQLRVIQIITQTTSRVGLKARDIEQEIVIQDNNYFVEDIPQKLSLCGQAQFKVSIINLYTVFSNSSNRRSRRIVLKRSVQQSLIAKLRDYAVTYINQILTALLSGIVLQTRISRMFLTVLDAVAKEPKLHAVNHATQERAKVTSCFPCAMSIKRIQGAIYDYGQGEGFIQACLLD